MLPKSILRSVRIVKNELEVSISIEPPDSKSPLESRHLRGRGDLEYGGSRLRGRLRVWRFETRSPFPRRISDAAPGINDIYIRPEIIKKILGKLKCNSAAGPDGLPPILFNKTKCSINFPLSIMYRTLIDLHTLPSEWKLSIITPVFKKRLSIRPS